MFCNKCGKSISDDSLFCNYCGAKVSAPAKPEKKASASSCKERIADWSEKHADFLKENSLELISVFKNDIAIAKSTEKLYSENRYYAIKGENEPTVLSEAKQRLQFDHGIMLFDYEYYDEREKRDREGSFLMKDNGFAYSRNSNTHIVTDEYVLTDSPVYMKWDNRIQQLINTSFYIYSLTSDKVVFGDFYTDKPLRSDDGICDFEFVPNASKYDVYEELDKSLRKRSGVVYSNGSKILYPDDDISYTLDGFSKTQKSYIFKLTNFKEYKRRYDDEIEECFTLEYLDLSGKSLAKFDNVCFCATERTCDSFKYDVITIAKRQYNEAEDEYEDVYTHIMVDHNTLNSVEVGTDKDDFNSVDLAEYNGVTCPYISMDGVTKLYNPKLELLTEISGRIAYTFTANHKLYSVNVIRDYRMGLDYTAVYNVNDNKDCFRVDKGNNYELLADTHDRSIHYDIHRYQTNSEQSPYIVKHKGREKALLVCRKSGESYRYKYGLVDLEGNIVVPIEYEWIDVAYETKQSNSCSLAVPKNYIYMGRYNGDEIYSLCDADGKFLVKDLQKDDFDRKVEELFPECKKSE